MGKLHFEFDEKGNMVISQCDFITTEPKKCDDCKHRFECFTERTKASKATLNSAIFPNLNDMMKQITLEFDEPKDEGK